MKKQPPSTVKTEDSAEEKLRGEAERKRSGIPRRALLAAVAGTMQGQESGATHSSAKADAPHLGPLTSSPLLVGFVAGEIGQWRIDRMQTIIGEGLSSAARLNVVEGVNVQASSQESWVLRGVTSNTRYTGRKELEALKQVQPKLNRSQATRAALIPIRKNEAWWALAQDERRSLLEEQSHHISIGLEYLPAIARRLHHSRELGEPFDFLTWFEYAPEDSDAFETLVRRLRKTAEWKYINREVDIRLSRA